MGLLTNRTRRHGSGSLAGAGRAALALGLWLTVLLAMVAGPCAAKVFLSRKEALATAFPTADQVVDRDVFLTSDQVARIEKESGAKLESELITIYEGKKQQRTLGFAFIDTHVVRTQPETFMVVLSPGGKVEAVFMCAFYEPQEYMPPDRWLAQFKGHSDPSRLRVGDAVVGITGSTLTARALTGGVRKAIAIWKVCLQRTGRAVQ
ncbi:MAG: FMN-binding protein [Candidatus Riflebacteria bacterium]|nr:FMN-binding protein [Candidatus Riflebacteria bacterium]